MFKLWLYRLKRPYHFFKTGLFAALPAQIKYRFPERQLTIVTVTGTDGKTTTSSLLHQMLSEAGIKTGLISTIAAKIGAKSIETGFHVTSPPPTLLFQVMAEMREAGCTHLVLEMTSHGAYQFRNWGIQPRLGIITNISSEHLDYHLTFPEYVRAKTGIFRATPQVFLPAQTSALPLIKDNLDIRKLHLVQVERGLPVTLRRAIKARFVERYNRENASLAAMVALTLGVEPAQLEVALAKFPNLPGRLQEIPCRKGVRVIVDFAHTPQAVEAVLKAADKTCRGRLIVVLGSAGLRDASKRPVMGRVAARLADLVVFTSEDPRTENPYSIINQLKSDLSPYQSKVLTLADRGRAIHFALTTLARSDDSVLILGKGHERSMCYGTTEYAWSDQEAVATVCETGEVPQLGKKLSI